MWSIRPCEAPAPSTVTSRSRRCLAGIWAIASSSISMWSAVVFDPALPVRSLNASDSPVLSHQAPSGCVAPTALVRARRELFVGVGDHQRPVHPDHDRATEVAVGHPGWRDPPVPGLDQRPHMRPGPGAKAFDLAALWFADLVQRAPQRRIRGHRPIQLGLVAQHGQVRQHPAAVGDRTAVSANTRPRSCTGVNPGRASAADRPAVRPARSVISRSAADPAWLITPRPPTSTARSRDQPVTSTSKVLLGFVG
jgi:hypothetical protein